MSEMEVIMIAKLFNTNNYTDTYTDNRFNPKIAKKYRKIILVNTVS